VYYLARYGPAVGRALRERRFAVGHAERVKSVLGPKGYWLCLAGSTEGPPREHGPRAARPATSQPSTVR
jgi:hypothetical protein